MSEKQGTRQWFYALAVHFMILDRYRSNYHPKVI